MPYIEEVCVAGNTVEISKYYSHRIHPKGEKRQKVGELTSEAQKRINQRRAGVKLRRLMNNNFRDGDYLLRLDFHNVHPKTSTEMQKLTSNFLRRLKRAFPDLKYIYVKELGKRGGAHLHMMINKCPPDLLRRAWDYGGIHIDPLYSEGQYRKIAEYFIKYAQKTEETEGELIGKRWYASRNLVPPKVKKRICKSNRFKAKIRILKDYYLDSDTQVYGINESGWEYYSYTLIKGGKHGRTDGYHRKQSEPPPCG